MIVVAALLGLLTGSLLDWAAGYLPRLAAKPVPNLAEAAARPALAVWQLARAAGRRGSLWLSAATELLGAALFAYLWYRFGPTWDFLLTTAACSFFLLVAIIDLRYRLVLNALVFPAMILTLAFHFTSPQGSPLIALEGGALGLAMFTLAALLRPGGLGGGDVKLATLIGLIFGFPHALWALMLGILAGGGVAVYLLALRRWGPARHIPYAPFLCLGAVVALLYNPLLLIV